VQLHINNIVILANKQGGLYKIAMQVNINQIPMKARNQYATNWYKKTAHKGGFLFSNQSIKALI